MNGRGNGGATLSCRTLQLHFIYNFLARPVYSITDANAEHYRALHALRAAAGAFDEVSDAGLRIEPTSYRPLGGEGELRDYLEPFVRLPMPQISGRIYKTTGIVLEVLDGGRYVPVKNCEVFLEGYFHCFATGWGAIRYVLTLFRDEQSGLNPADLVHLSNLGLQKREAGSIAPLACPFRLSLREVDSNARVEVILEQRFFRDLKAVTQDLGLEALESYAAWDAGSPRHQLAPYPQNPFPVIIGEILPDLYASAFESSRSSALSRAVHQEILTVLFRSLEFGFPDETFAADHLSFRRGRLPNLCSTRRLFLQLYLRSAVALSPELALDKSSLLPTTDPSCYIVPAFVGAVESLRMRWYVTAVLNQWLEDGILTLCRASLGGRPMRQAIKKTAELRALLGASLTDPVTYRYGSGSLTKLYGVGVHTFRIQEVERLLVERLELLDQLLQDAIFLTRMEVEQKGG